MSEENTQTGNEELDNDDLQVNELDLLKSRAKMLGITFSNNIGVDALKEKINAKTNSDEEERELPDGLQPNDTALTQESEQDKPTAVPAALATTATAPAAPAVARPQTEKQKKVSVRKQLMEENMRLIRIRIVCLDPKKKDLPGEILTVANEFLGTVSKFVPFGEATDNGYHVPYVIYKMLKNRKFLSLRTYKDRQNANAIKIEQRWANEFAIEVLEPLTKDELAKLAAAQTSSGNLG